jgi:hypothetical protein
MEVLLARLAYANDEGHVVVAELAGAEFSISSQRDLSDRGRGASSEGSTLVDNWPTWSPDGTRVAFVRVELAGGEVRRTGIWVVTAGGETSAEVYSSSDANPIYMAWSPDGERIGVLVQSGRSLALRVVPTDSPRPPVTIAQGAPLYFAWGPDSRSIIAHIGSPGVSALAMRLVLLELRGGNATRDNLAAPPASGFRAPSWRPGHAEFAAAYERVGGAEIAVRATPEEPARTIVETGVAPTFVWAPDGEQLAYAAREPEEAETYAGISVVSAAGSAPRKLTEEQVIAFGWSPDSRTLVSCAGGSSGRLLHLVAFEVASGSATDLGWVRPTRDLWFALGHFDQYADSMALVSSDNAQLVVAASHARDAENGVVPTVRQIIARPLTGQGPDVIVGHGRTASWAPPT